MYNPLRMYGLQNMAFTRQRRSGHCLHCGIVRRDVPETKSTKTLRKQSNFHTIQSKRVNIPKNIANIIGAI